MTITMDMDAASWGLEVDMGAMTGMFVGVVRSRQGDGTALARLQSDPILTGVAADAGIDGGLIDPSQPTPRPTHAATVLAFHYHDDRAVDYVRNACRLDKTITALCFCGDIYSYHKYARIQDFVTAFIAPTTFHKTILSYRLPQSVYVLEEAVDPIALGGRCRAEMEAFRFSARPRSRRLVWFGYSESFHKGMDSLIPPLKRCVQSGDIDAFDLVLDTDRYQNPFSLTQLPFDQNKFFDTMKSYDYAVLSHFPLDLHINSYIKSPNKLVTSLFCGLIPIASDTPSYRELMTRLGLDGLLFDSPDDLRRLLTGLDPQRDAERLDESAPLASILHRNSAAATYEAFRAIIRDVRTRAADIGVGAIESTCDETPPPTFRSHLRDLLPSAIRGIRRRL